MSGLGRSLRLTRKVDRGATGSQGSLTDGLSQGGMAMHSLGNFVQGRFKGQSESTLVDQIAGVRRDDVQAQDLAESALADYLDESA